MNKQISGNFLTRQFKFVNLRLKIFLAFLLVSLIAIGILTLVTNTIVRTELTRSVGADLKSKTLSQARTISDQLTTQIDIISALGLSKTVTDKIKLANASYDPADPNLQAGIAQLDQQWIAADAAKNDSDPLVQSRMNSLLAVELRNFRATAPQHVEVFVTDQYGALVATTNRTSDYNQGDEAWWQATFNNGKGAVYIEQPALDESSGVVSSVLAVPLHDPATQAVIGVLRSTLDVAFLEHSLELAKFGTTGQVDLLLPSGQSLEWDGNFEPVAPDALAQLGALSGQDYAQINYQGGDKLLSQTDIISSKPSGGEYINNLGWKVLAEQDSSEALQLVNIAVRTGLLASLGALLLTGLISIFMAQTLVRPIDRLTATAEKVRAGDLTAQAKVESRDEIGTLATTFNSMTAQLRDLIGSLEQRVADRTKALATSSEVSRRLSTILNQKELVSEVVNQVKNAFGYYHAQIYFYDEANEDLVMAGGTGEAGETMLAGGHKVPKGRGLVGRAAESNQAVLVSDTSQNPDWLPNPLLPETKSEVAIPISIGDEVLGVLDVQHDIKDGLQQEDIDSLQSIANQTAIALQNIQSTEIVAKRAAELQTVASISTVAATINDVQKMLESVVHLIQRRFGLYHAHVFIYDEDTTILKIAACGYKEGDEHEGTHGTAAIPLTQEQSLVARAGRTRQAVIVNDVRNEPGWLPNPLLPDTASELAVPMIVGNQLLGVLDVQSEHLNAFTEEDANIQTTLASQVATALQNARSFLQSQHQAERETAVNLITQKIQNATTIENALQVAVRELGHSLGMQASVRLEADKGHEDYKNPVEEGAS